MEYVVSETRKSVTEGREGKSIPRSITKEKETQILDK